VLATFILLVAVFFWFQRYIVHTPDGVRLDIPFLRGILDEIPEADPDADTQEEASVIPVTPADTAEYDQSVMPPDLPPFRSVLITAEDLERMPDVNLTLEGARADAILIPVNDETGQLWWRSDVGTATRYALYGTGDLNLMLETIAPEIGRSALLVGFHNRLMAQRNPPAGLYGAEYWLDPRNVEMRDYIRDLALELGQMGFDEIVLKDFSFPPDYTDAEEAVILAFLQELVNALSLIDVSLGVVTRESDWYAPDGDVYPSRPGPAQLSDIALRLYCVLDPETAADPERYEALMAAVQSVLGGGAYRFVPIGPGSSSDGINWVVQL